MAGRDSFEKKYCAYNNFQTTTELITTLPDHLQLVINVT